MRHARIREATIAINVEFSSTTTVLHMLIAINHQIHSSILVYFNYFARNSSKSTTPVSNRKWNPTRRNENSPTAKHVLSDIWGSRNVLRRFWFKMAQFVNKKGSDDVFLWDFCLNKPIKFNSGQYMNNTLEGGPLVPIFQSGLLIGAAQIRVYRVHVWFLFI